MMCIAALCPQSLVGNGAGQGWVSLRRVRGELLSTPGSTDTFRESRARPVGGPLQEGATQVTARRHPGHDEHARSSSEGSSSPDGVAGPAWASGEQAALAALPGGGLDAKVLVLNKLYMAVRVISAKRAFAMLYRDLAEVVHVESGTYQSFDFESWSELSQLAQEFEPDQHDWVRTVSFSMAVPRVIRLLGYDRMPRQGVKLNRRNLFARDRNRCQYCGNSFPTSELSIDHVVPRSQGGGESWTNLVCSCVRCNARKGGRTPEQARMKLIRPVREPRRNPLISLRLGQERYESWKAFLDNAYWSVELR